MTEHRQLLLEQVRTTRAEARQARRLSRVLVPPGLPSNLALYARELDAEADALERRAAEVEGRARRH